jgi:hypothetical protein
MVTVQRAGNRTKKCKGESTCLLHKKKKQWQKNTKQRKTKTTMHASSGGRERKWKWYQSIGWKKA